MIPTRASLICALFATACGSSVTVAPLDAATTDIVTSDTVTIDGSAPDVAAPDVAAPSACARWAVSDQVVVVSDPAERVRYLLDAVATPDGALVAWRELAPYGQDDQVRLRRVNDDGTLHPWSAPGRGSRRQVVSLTRMGDLQFSMVWDAARDGVALLTNAPADRGACHFTRFLGDDSQSWQLVDLSTIEGFPLAGCGSLARTLTGWSLLAAEVRATWGDQLVFLTEDGRIAGTPTRLPMTQSPSIDPMTRTAVAGGFVATWSERDPMPPRTGLELHARRFDPSGAPLGDDVLLDRANTTYFLPRVLDTREGLLAAWYANGIVFRPLRADASPSGGAVRVDGVLAAFGVHAEVRGADTLAVTSTAVSDASMSQFFFLVADGRGALRGAPMRVLPDRPLMFANGLRVVPTRRGALIVFGQGERVLAVPVDCVP